MKKIFTTLAVTFIVANSYAQVITQNATPNTVTANASVACSATGVESKENYYSRAFKLSDYGITYDYKITNIAFGVESASTALNVEAGVYRLNSGTYPSGPTTFLNSVPVAVSAANNLGMANTGTDLEQVIPAGSTFIVEIAHNGTGTGTFFWMGANSGAETAPSYIKAPGCGLAAPATTTSIGFPNAKWVMTITGSNNLGITEVINSRQLQIYPNPVKDVLNFKMDKGLNAESIEVYDMSGKLIPMKTTKAVTSVNVSNLTKGNYILKVKADDGKTHIQKIIKE